MRVLSRMPPASLPPWGQTNRNCAARGLLRNADAQVLAHGGVAGLHVMPIGKASKALALRMLAEGALPPSV